MADDGNVVYDTTSRSANNSVDSEEMQLEEDELVDPNDEYDPDAHGVNILVYICTSIWNYLRLIALPLCFTD